MLSEIYELWIVIGIGIITSYLTNINFNPTGIDINDNILELVKTLGENFLW